MDRSFAIIDRDGSVIRKATLIPLELKPGNRLSVRYTGPYVKFNLGRMIARAFGCTCHISTREARRENGTVDFYHEYEIVGTDLGIIQQMMDIIEKLFGANEVTVALNDVDPIDPNKAQKPYEKDSDMSQ